MSEAAHFDNPILNSPYDPPECHFVIGPNGPTGETREGRRPSESFVPIPVGRRSRTARTEPVAEQTSLDLATGERREANSLINDIRSRVDRWRAYGYPGVTPVSRKLLEHWADPNRDDRMLFCQREAAETAIYLTEVAGRRGEPDFRTRTDEANREHNDGLPRLALKMATGSGKTVVMAMLIAWHTANKSFSPRDARFANRFLVVTPGITIRDRLRVLLPSDDANYYRERDLVPPDLWPTLAEASISILNYHGFLLRDAKEIRGVASTTRKVLTAGKKVDPFTETDEQMVERVLRDLAGRGRGEIVVLNDEAHHCYQDRTSTEERIDAEAKERNEGARVWFRGLRAIDKYVGVKAVYDLSATPFYLSGSGWREGYIFPWTVSDFSLMDAIESGIVKVPRVPVDDDAKPHQQPTYLALWDHVGAELPKKGTRKPGTEVDRPLPDVLEGALFSLYRSYERRFYDWTARLADFGEPPPVFIVVCPNTIVSKMVYDWIAGQSVETPAGEPALRAGRLELLSNVVDGRWVDRSRTVLIDSAQLESGDKLSDEFKKAAATEIEIFKSEYRRRFPGADVEKLTDEDLLREVMNTVGKRGRLGEHVRCVVSVSMLTEGWDANTVTHILGIRRFGSQLLCEQVVGRGLRRRSYAPNPDGRFEPEYAEVYGVPFAFLPSERDIKAAPPARPPEYVYALDDRSELEIRFPKVETYRIELPEEPMFFDESEAAPLHIDREDLATWTVTGGIAGGVDEQELTQLRAARPQEVAYEIAADLIRRRFAGQGEGIKPWLFPSLVDVARRWLDSDRVTFGPDTPVGYLLLSEPKARATEAIFLALRQVPGARREVLLPIMRAYDPYGSTGDVHFSTRKKAIDTSKSHINKVVLDGVDGNTWEETVTGLLEADPRVAAYVKNDHLDFAIPYLYEGRTHQYLPDFLVRLTPRSDDDIDRILILEVSGGRKRAQSPGSTKEKGTTARDIWCTAVNNHCGFGRWGYVEVETMLNAASDIGAAIEALYADEPIIGDPDRLLLRT